VPKPTRRELLASTAVTVLLGPEAAKARDIKGSLPWLDGQTEAPTQVGYGPWRFFNLDEAAAVEAMVDRLIPPDPETPGGKNAGCAVFIDRQLAGPYGDYQDYYMKGPFQKGAKSQGDQSPVTPSQRYRTTLAAIDKHCRTAFSNTPFAKLSTQQQDSLLKQMEAGKLDLQNADAKTFFGMLLVDTKQGFFADPIYGGNRDMVGWKMIGYPGARYDNRDWVHRHNQPYTLPPIGIKDHPNWG
jgi:gluconate 2-dehydrogenase gamma chain